MASAMPEEETIYLALPKGHMQENIFKLLEDSGMKVRGPRRGAPLARGALRFGRAEACTLGLLSTHHPTAGDSGQRTRLQTDSSAGKLRREAPEGVWCCFARWGTPPRTSFDTKVLRVTTTDACTSSCCTDVSWWYACIPAAACGAHVRDAAQPRWRCSGVPVSPSRLPTPPSPQPQNILGMLQAGTRDLGFAGADWVEELGITGIVQVLDTGA